MGASGSFEKLSQLIEQYESDGGRVQRVEAVAADRESGTGLNVTLDVPVSLCSDEESGTEVSPQTATVADDGGLQVEFSPAILPDVAEYTPEGVSTESEDVRVTDDGTILATFELTFGVESDHQRSPTSSSVDTDSRTGSATVTAERVRASDDTETSDDTEASDTSDTAVDGDESAEETDDRTDVERELDAARNEDLPTYEDTEYLRCLYESFDTFTEMSEHLDMEVASETVRRYMIEAGVHEPSSYDTVDESEADTPESATSETDDPAVDDDSATEDSEDAGEERDEGPSRDESTEDERSPEPEQERVTEVEDPIETISNKKVVTDGIGLPDDLTIEELADAIQSSMTLFEVQRRLDLDRKRTDELLNQLNLIDLVRGRLAHASERQVSREEIAKRIRTSSTSDC